MPVSLLAGAQMKIPTLTITYISHQKNATLNKCGLVSMYLLCTSFLMTVAQPTQTMPVSWPPQHGASNQRATLQPW